MTKTEFDENQINNLKAILHKGASVWFERNFIDTKRVKEIISISQTKLNTDISINFVINPPEKED